MFGVEKTDTPNSMTNDENITVIESYFNDDEIRNYQLIFEIFERN
jgi:hypothetical protein